MKLRIQNNSIRLRLNRREVAAFTAAGSLEEAFEHPLGRLVYGIQSSATARETEVQVGGEGIRIVLPADLALTWTGTDRVGVSAEIELGHDKRLSVLVEKEFRRLHGANNDPDLYPNPLEGQ